MAATKHQRTMKGVSIISKSLLDPYLVKNAAKLLASVHIFRLGSLRPYAISVSIAL
jgi:hypothetical protein